MEEAMSRRRIEMFKYRIVLAQMRRGASEREIARSHYMGRNDEQRSAATRRLTSSTSTVCRSSTVRWCTSWPPGAISTSERRF